MIASDQFDNDSTPGNQATTPNEDDTASATVTPVATDLNVTKTVDDDSPDQGDNITFTITVNNTSAVNATNVVLTDLSILLMPINNTASRITSNTML